MVGEVMANAERAYAHADDGAAAARRASSPSQDASRRPSQDADLIQESVPERLDLKRKVLAEIDAARAGRRADRLVDLGHQADRHARDMKHPERLFVAHPSTRSTCCRSSRSSAARRPGRRRIERAKAMLRRRSA